MLRSCWRWKNIDIKYRDPSLKLEGLMAALHRLSTGHSIYPVLAGKQSTVEAGIGGEERVAEILSKNSLPFDYHTFHDLSLSSDFQIDTHCLTPWYAVVLEVKNISGALEFKETPPQLVRTREDGSKDGFDSPVVQLERNCELLKEFYRSRHIHLPIFGAVVLAYPKQIVIVPPAKTTLLFPNLIPSYLKNIPRQTRKLDTETFKWLSNELLTNHHRFVPKPICEVYKIPFGDFKPGVRCYTCGKIGMIKVPRTWLCPYCKATSSMAHVKALREWFLIYKRTITNRECRWFLQLGDKYTASHILASMNMDSSGTFKDRSYKFDFNIYD